MNNKCVVEKCDNKRDQKGRSKRTGKILYRLRCYKHSHTQKYLKRRNRHYSDASLLQYKQLLIKQQDRCKICNGTSNGRRFSLDHDHSTGKIRGLLCNNCNMGLGLFKDSIAILKKAIKYLN